MLRFINTETNNFLLALRKYFFEFYIKSGMFIDTVRIPLQIHIRISKTEKITQYQYWYVCCTWYINWNVDRFSSTKDIFKCGSIFIYAIKLLCLINYIINDIWVYFLQIISCIYWTDCTPIKTIHPQFNYKCAQHV